MPPRLVVVAIFVAWLSAIGWLAVERWKVPAERPPFAIDMSDEVAPQHASWIIFQNGKQVGHAETRIAPRRDGQFELSTRLRDLNLSRDNIELKVPLVAVTRIVSHDGDLRSVDAKLLMNVQGPELEGHVDATIHGRTAGADFIGECELDAGAGKIVEPLDPVPLGAATTFAPLEPLHKYPPLRVGQSWRLSNVDIVADGLALAYRQAATKKTGVDLGGPPPPKEVRARVTAGTEEIGHRERRYTCRIIVFEADRIIAKVWIDVTDGKVIRQEATALGQVLVLQRD
jgi:hypothetical protein